MKLAYPAIFTPFDAMATDAASGWVLTELKDGKKAPKASNIEDIQPPKESFTSLIVLDMDTYVNQ